MAMETTMLGIQTKVMSKLGEKGKDCGFNSLTATSKKKSSQDNLEMSEVL